MGGGGVIARRICRRKGHRIDPDPGDFVLHCLRCGAEADLHELAAAMAEKRGGCVDKEPQETGAVVIARLRWDTHRVSTDREWVRLASHAENPWITTDDLGNLVAFSWGQLIPARDLGGGR